MLLDMTTMSIPSGGQERTLLGGLKERKARKACRKAMMVFRRVVFAFASQIKAQRIIPEQRQGEGPKG